MKFTDLLETPRERDEIFDELPLSKEERPPKSNGRAVTHQQYYQQQRAAYIGYLNRLYEKLWEYTPDDITLVKQDKPKPTAPGWLLVGTGHFPRYNYHHSITEPDKIYLWCHPDKDSGELRKENAASPKALAAVEKYLRAKKKVEETEIAHAYYLGRIQREEEDKRRQRYAAQRAAKENRETARIRRAEQAALNKVASGKLGKGSP